MIAALTLALAPMAASDLELGPWRAWLESPGGELPFGLELAREGDELRATIVNGEERIEVPEFSVDGERFRLEFPHYDSVVSGRIDASGGALEGEWRKRRGPDDWTEMEFRAVAGDPDRFTGRPSGTSSEDLHAEFGAALSNSLIADGRFRARFSSSEDPAVLVLDRGRRGTFLTTTGDYRYLAGSADARGLRLSCFDGAHAFLFHARIVDENTLEGDFWSRDKWHETWTAVRDPNASLPDPFAETSWESGTSLAELVFPDLDGEPRSLADPAFAGRARILQVFGSWCPNCHDEAPFLAELHDRYAERGLSITSLAFELTGDFERDAQQVRRYAERYGIEFPILVGGLSDKGLATAAFPALDRVRSYPTTIFLAGDGSVHSVHTGFSGPATGEAHEELRREFETTIEELLAAPAPDDTATWEWLVEHTFVERALRSGMAVTFTADDSGQRIASVQRTATDPRKTQVETFPVTLQAGTVAIGNELWQIDRRARVLRSPFAFGRRLTSDPRHAAPLVGELRDEAALVAALESDDPVERREALYALARRRADRQQQGLPDAARLGEEHSLPLRVAAAWAAGVTVDRRSVPQLLANMEHPYAGLRRESARALMRLAVVDPSLLPKLETWAADPDPLVRRALER